MSPGEFYPTGPEADYARRLVEEQFKIIGGNCETLEEARIICLARAHFPLHDQLVRNFIATHSRLGLVILYEGDRDQEEVHIPPDTTLRGWDDMLMHNEAVQIVIEVRDSDSLDKNRLVELNRRRIELMKLRNCSMIFVLNQYPGRPILIDGGERHFTADPDLIAELSKYKFIVITPKAEISPEDSRRHIESI